jgi:hypothetical protein
MCLFLLFGAEKAFLLVEAEKEEAEEMAAVPEPEVSLMPGLIMLVEETGMFVVRVYVKVWLFVRVVAETLRGWFLSGCSRG